MSTRVPRACPRPSELERSYWSDPAATRDHRADCEPCAEQFREIEQLAALAGSLAVDVSVDRREQSRTAVLAAARADARAPKSTSRYHRYVAAGSGVVAIAAGVALYFAYGGSSTAPKDDGAAAGNPPTVDAAPAAAYRGTVTAVDSKSRFMVASAQPDEVVRLDSGSIEVSVRTLSPGQRFRVVTGDAEVEVRGTAFRVTAEDGRLVSVAVREGLVVVRASNGERSLTAGERWERLSLAAPVDGAKQLAPPDDARARHPNKPKPHRIAPVAKDGGLAPPKSVREPTDYERGWTALRARRYKQAAAEFDKALAAPPVESRADVLYWSSVAHYRAGNRNVSRARLSSFLSTFASDRRAAEVSVMLGWIELDKKRHDSARKLFTRGLTSAKKSVRDSAKAGVRALGAAGEDSD